MKKFLSALMCLVVTTAGVSINCSAEGLSEVSGEVNEAALSDSALETTVTVFSDEEEEENPEISGEEVIINNSDLSEAEESSETDSVSGEIINGDLAESTVSYAVEGGNIYFDPNTGTVTDADKTVTAADIPSRINSVTVKSIGDSAFFSCDNLTSISLPSTIVSIGDYAFMYCENLTSITIPKNVSSLGSGVFYGCSSLKRISVSSSNTVYSSSNNILYNYEQTELICYPAAKISGSVTIADSVKVIADYAFACCANLTKITIPETVETIGESAFIRCSGLTELNIPNGVKDIGDSAFYYCPLLTSVVMGDSVTNIGSSAFYNCYRLKTLTLSAGLTAIGSEAFCGCESITEVNIPESVLTIGKSAFNACESMSKLTLHEGLTTIEAMAFYSCSSLTSVSIPSTVVEIGSSAFSSAVEKVYCYEGSAGDKYSWGSSVEKIYLEETVSPPSFNVAGVFGGRNVTFSSVNEGAVIYYSTTSSTLTTSDLCVENGETVLFENFYGTVYARTYYHDRWSNVSRLILKIPVVNTPEITISDGKATIRSSTPSSYIYYTTDGTTPTRETGKSLGLNGGTFSVKDGTTVKAIAVRSCFTNSETASLYIPVSPAAFTVVGTFGGRNVTFKSDTADAKIYYSSTTSNLTTDDTCVENGETVLFENFYGTIYAKAYYNGKWSNVSRLILKIPTINTPTITFSATTATIRTTTPSCYIYYTTDGSEPSVTNGTKLSANSYGQISVSNGTYVRAIAVRSCFTNSDIAMDSVYSEKVLEIVNSNRADDGQASLTIDSDLNYAAYLKAKDFVDKGYFSHTSPTYGSPGELLDFLGISYGTWGENIAYGQSTPSAVMTAWMNSSGHRANILDADYGKIGIGYYYYQGTPYWVQIFTD